MEPSKNKWEGLGVIVVVRQSSDKDGTGSTKAQLDYLVKDVAKVGMEFVDEEVLEGVSAASPARITELL